MKNHFLTVDEAAELIGSGAVVFVAGSAELMRRLPKGRWIGGTTAYFMTTEGGLASDERLFCTQVTEAANARTAVLPANRLGDLVTGRYAHGFAGIIAPAFSEAHSRYALEAAGLPGLFDQPVFGWVAGTRLPAPDGAKPLVFDGATGEAHEDGLAVLYVALPQTLSVDLDIVNLFVQGDGDVIEFPEGGFTAREARVNGAPVNFAQYVAAKGLDTRLPLVADYAGAMINVSFQEVDQDKGEVRFYAPVTPGVAYRLARPVADYAGSYANACFGQEAAGALSCNCILNYLYADLEGASTGGFIGPVTFGEFAYLLLNQTLSRLVIFSPVSADFRSEMAYVLG